MVARSSRFLASAALLLALWLLACPAAALAHARLIRSMPASQARMATPPDRVELWFSELLEDGFNSVEVVPVGELAVKPRNHPAYGIPALDRLDRTHLVLALEHLGSGEYAVEWRVLSRDGHSSTGRFTFSVQAVP